MIRIVANGKYYEADGEEFYPGQMFRDTGIIADKYDGLKQLRPKLAQPWWYRLVGFKYAKPDQPSRGAQAAIRRNERKRAKMRLYCVPKKPVVAALLLLAAPLHAQIVDSLVKYCPPGFVTVGSTADTVVVIPQRYDLRLGQSIYLRAIQCGFQKVREVSKARGVKWASSDTMVLKVSRTTGRVTAVKPGAATIYATYP